MNAEYRTVIIVVVPMCWDVPGLASLGKTERRDVNRKYGQVGAFALEGREVGVGRGRVIPMGASRLL